MRVAIVGANSFLSQALLSLVSSDYEVLQVYNERQDRLSEKFSRISINGFLKEKPVVNYLFFIASYIDFDEGLRSLNQLLETNILLLKRISETFEDVKIIHSSSVAVYELSNTTINEESRVNPSSSYGMSKLWAESIVRNHKGGGVNIRISSLFGEGMNQKTFLPKIIQSAIVNKQITIYGDGTRMQNYIYVKDAADILFRAMCLKTTLPLLAVGNNSYSNIQIAIMVTEFFPELEIVHHGTDNSASFFYDNQHTRKLLDIPVSNTFKKQLRNTALWLQKQF